MRNTLAEDGSVAALEGNDDSVSKKLLNGQRGGTGKLSVVDAGGDTTKKLPKAIAHGASGLENQRDEGGRFNSGQLVILLPLLVLALLRSPKRAESSPRGQGRRRGGMSDRDIQHEPSPAEAEAKIRSSTILSASLRNRPKARLTKEGDKQLQDESVARCDGPTPQVLADHKMISQELLPTPTASDIGGGRGKPEAKPSSKPEIVVGEAQLGPRRYGVEPAGRTGLSQAEEVRRETRVPLMARAETSSSTGEEVRRGGKPLFQ